VSHPFRQHDARPKAANGPLAISSTTSWSGDAMVDDLDAF
jgi:hypothetical protein